MATAQFPLSFRRYTAPGDGGLCYATAEFQSTTAGFCVRDRRFSDGGGVRRPAAVGWESADAVKIADEQTG